MDWKDILRKIAPTAAAALGGPLAGAAVALIGDAIGIAEPTQEKIAQAFENNQLTGEQIARIKEKELELKKEEQERGFRYSELEFKNVQGAREMQVQTHSPVPAVLSGLITVGFFAILAAMFKYPEIKESAPLMIMLGSLGSAFGAVVNFWLGSAHQPNVRPAKL